MHQMNFLTVVALFGFIRSSSNSVPKIELCDESTSEYHLTDSGFGSALNILFTKAPESDGDGSRSRRRSSVVRDPCKLKITAPETHIVSVFFADIPGAADDEPFSKLEAAESSRNTSCMISIYLPENRWTAIWKVNPCQKGEILPPARLLTPHLRIVWNPPPFNETPKLLSRTQLVLTVVGRDQTCQRPGQHTCLKNGLLPLMCIADALVCDGVVHCPRDISDENPLVCAGRGLSSSSPHDISDWGTLAKEIFKISKTRRNNNLPTNLFDNNIFIHRHTISRPSTTPWSILPPHFTETPPHIVAPDDDDDDDDDATNDDARDAFAHYGPWGYLMLGMLICGMVLMVCGFWECCCRKSKPATIGPTRRTLVNGVTHDRNATVLVLTNERGPMPPTLAPALHEIAPPPAYDDLDRPPSYCTLFPHLKSDDRIAFDSYVVVPDRRIAFEMDLTAANRESPRDSTYTETEIENETVDTNTDSDAATAVAEESNDAHNERPADSNDVTDEETNRRTAVRESNEDENRTSQRPVVVLSDVTEESSAS